MEQKKRTNEKKSAATEQELGLSECKILTKDPYNNPFKQEYIALWDTMQITESIDWYVERMLDFKEKYQGAEKLCEVPWEVIAVIHMMEAGGNLSKQILNGQRWNQVTTMVPRGLGPWDSFGESCADAFVMIKKTKKMPEDWNIPNMLYYCEIHNGIGYRKYHPEVSSPIVGLSATPYLWSFTNHYSKGKYTNDGHFDPNAISKQPGVAALLRGLGYQNI